jgi:hypothetical protein
MRTTTLAHYNPTDRVYMKHHADDYCYIAIGDLTIMLENREELIGLLDRLNYCLNEKACQCSDCSLRREAEEVTALDENQLDLFVGEFLSKKNKANAE